MPSRAERPRRPRQPSGAAAVEGALRAVAIVLLAFGLWRAAVGAGTGGIASIASSRLASALPSLVRARAGGLHVVMDAFPTPAERDALAAMAHAGTRVTWSGPAMVPLAVVAERAREPGGPVRVAVASAAGVALADALSALDSVPAARAAPGATTGVGAPSGELEARSGRVRTPVGVPAEVALRRVLVVGRAGWEAKFAVAALEEQGWSVDARLSVAPGAGVTQGPRDAIDTSRYSAVVALDTTLGPVATSVAPFVRSGGGLVLLAGAANAPGVRAMAPARAGVRRAAGTRGFDAPDPMDAMPLYPLEALRGDAVPLSRRGALVTAAARREGAGRVLQAGFDDTWRWRMQGGAGSVAAHRAWWSRLVGSVAAVPLPAADRSPAAAGAPVARLVDAIGPPAAVAPAARRADRLPAWLLPTILLCLLTEWGSRRWRGAR